MPTNKLKVKTRNNTSIVAICFNDGFILNLHLEVDELEK